MTTNVAHGRSVAEARRDPRKELISQLPVTERRIDIAGVSTAVLEGGRGTPLVVLHGPGEFAARWLRAIPALASTHRVIIPDLPGHGISDVSSGELTATRVISWLDELITRTCARPPVLVGHILGGGLAARFAVEHGRRLERLVLVDSLGLAPFRPSFRFAFSMVAFLARPSEGSYNRMMANCEYDRDALAAEMGESWNAVRDYSLERARAPKARAAMRTLMREVGTPPIPPDRLARIPVPTTLIWGRHDRALSLSIARGASERYGWPLHVIEDAADDAPMEQPAAFVEALHRALSAGSPDDA